jgi:hypothetical protein
MSARRFRPLVTVLAAVLVVAGGIGWLSLLTGVALLDAGPPVPGALPLRRLAGADAQPLARVLAAWLGAGIVMAAVLAPRRRVARALVAALIGLVTLVAIGAVQDAVTTSEPPFGHVLSQLSREGLWVAVAVLAACALIPAPPAPTEDAAADATRRREDEGAAAGHTPRPA